MSREFCPGCAYGPAKSSHNGRGRYCSQESQTLKRKPSLAQQVLRFISGK